MTKLIAIIYTFLFLTYLATMMYGWGLTPKSWPMVIAGWFIGLLMGAIAEALAKR